MLDLLIESKPDLNIPCLTNSSSLEWKGGATKSHQSYDQHGKEPLAKPLKYKANIVLFLLFICHLTIGNVYTIVENKLDEFSMHSDNVWNILSSPTVTLT